MEPKLETFSRILGWLWLIAKNIFYVGVVLYVFAHLKGNTENIIVSILGLIYVSVRGQALGSSIFFSKSTLAFAHEFAKIRALLNDQSSNEEKDEFVIAAERTDRNFWKTVVSAVFTSIIGVICLLDLFSNLHDVH
jgi:hypothetical protein